MKTAYIEVPRDNWGVVIIYDYDLPDWYDLSEIMGAFGLPERKTRDALNVLAEYNTGMTISRDDIRMSVVFVGAATSESQWWDTLAHEMKHVADAILSYYDVVYDSEDAAYLTGYLMQKAVNHFGEPCR